MPITASFTTNEIDFASRKAILVDERAIAATADDALAGVNGHHVLDAADFVVGFDLELWAFNGALLDLKAAGGTPCYFLPYKRDCGISMTLGGGADYFFTSTLSGCSVQVTGPQNAPLVTHANAYTIYQHQTEDGANAVVASAAAQAAIDVLLPAPNGLTRAVRKADYLARVTAANMAVAKSRHKLKKSHHRMGNFAAYRDAGGQEKVGAFVFGKRSGGNWSFYYQATVAVVGTRHTGLIWGRQTKAFLPEDAVVGMAQRFYP